MTKNGTQHLGREFKKDILMSTRRFDTYQYAAIRPPIPPTYLVKMQDFHGNNKDCLDSYIDHMKDVADFCYWDGLILAANL